MQNEPRVILDALDALGLALADHDHMWTHRERRLYERAISFLCRKDFDLLALEKGQARPLFFELRLANDPSSVR